jgi:uncharacterized protein (TIGR02391 family)
MKRRTEYSKAKLKSMFLKVLYEIQYGDLGWTWDIKGIIGATIDVYFGVSLTPDERERAYEGVEELRSSKFIIRDYDQGESFVLLTAKGKELVENGKDPDVHGVQLQEIIRDLKILAKCQDDFDSGKYENAIFSAFKLVEEEVRNKAGLDESHYGTTLFTKALHHDRGMLHIPQCKLPSEQEGVYNLFKGAIALFKNPSSHRTVNYEDPSTAIEIIAFAELLLQILSTAQTKP